MSVRGAVPTSLVWLAAVAAACGGGGSGGLEPAGGEPELGEVLTDPSPSELQLPLDEYLWTASESATLENAEDVLIRQCMGEQGYQFELAPRPTDDAGDNRRRYTLIEPEAAEAHGYQVPPSPEIEAVIEAQQADAETMTPAAYGTFQGCLGAASDELGSAMLDDDDNLALQNLRSESFDRSLQDSRVQAAFDAWSDCMGEAGFDYADPQEPPADPAWVDRDRGDAPARDEIAVARADVDCKQQENLTGIWFAVESAYQADMIEENQERLDELKARIDGALERAADVLDDPALGAGT